ncbi:hypothetical protein HYC85_021733 [Camellia sinensis]|uniref:4Fe-4S ferredoxin-type domain-containing protein n=1 Tax=Camellia sinensis TaxID=4442 RepID=A0A7J7GM99_CAMSI|nr:hypothetical protein HYC85_021733 [Camellia sinensis]
MGDVLRGLGEDRGCTSKPDIYFYWAVAHPIWEYHFQSVPIMYPNAKIMKGIIEEDGFKETSSHPLKLSVNFNIEEQPSNSSKFQEMGSCLACGNCLAGSPYNVKNSTDKNYLVSSVQVLMYPHTLNILCVSGKMYHQNTMPSLNPDYICKKEDKVSRKKRRPWHIYLNEIDYVASDFVILSGGVFGMTEILFQSQMRGLKLSERLGSGFSCNGNTVAYLDGSPTPLGAYALDKRQFTKIPFRRGHAHPFLHRTPLHWDSQFRLKFYVHIYRSSSSMSHLCL